MSSRQGAKKKPIQTQSADQAASPQPDADNTQSTAPSLIPVIGIGASAGGLDPIEQLFESMPVDSGSAFVIIQHLSPDFKSLMDQLLARHSSMKILKIADGMEIKPNSIYLNTPRTVMTLDGNHLRVAQAEPDEQVYLPINIFFESLAANRGADSIAVILSGTGSDGTKGSTYISEAGGHVLVQDPESARFDGMPRSALADGKSTVSAPPAVLANCVVKLLKKESIDDLDLSKRLPISDPLDDVLSMLKHSHGTDFLQYKDATINRRIERRAYMRGIESIDDYRDYLSTDQGELEELYADLLIEVTEFFRDQAAFEVLEKSVIPKLIDDLPENGMLRVWVPGCASGEEAYSIAILLLEYARKSGKVVPLKIMATDIHIRSMSKASAGIYDELALKKVPNDIIERYFDRADGQAQIKKYLRNMVFFSTHDVTGDPPFTRIDLIGCRNLLIYLKEQAQEKVMGLLHFSLRKDGYLFLGPSEHIGAIAHEFEPVNEKWRIYKKLRDVKLLKGESIFQRKDIGDNITRNAQRIPVPQAEVASADQSIPFKRAHRSALEDIVKEYAPAGFLLSHDGDVVHIFGGAGKLFPEQSGSFSRRLVDLIKPDLKVIVTTALEHGRHKEFSGFSRKAYIKNETEEPVCYEVKLRKVDLPAETVRFQLMTIEKIERLSNETQPVSKLSQEEIMNYDSSDVLHQRISSLELNLQSSEENLQSTIEELETSNEELQSTNEELMSTNEELQSTNEELHSVNEELYTVSSEHQRKIEDLTEKDADIDLLLRTSKIATIHLDEQMRLRRYSDDACSIFNILPTDIGRPIQHITVQATGDDDIVQMVERVSADKQTLNSRMMSDGRVFLVRIMPYNPEDIRPSGVVITIVDITDIESANSELSSLNSQYNKLAEKTNTGLLHWDAETSLIKHCNSHFATARGCAVKDIVGQEVWNFFPAGDKQKYKQMVSEIEPDGVGNLILNVVSPNGQLETKNVYIHAISDDGLTVQEYQSIGQDISEEVNYKKALEELFLLFSDDELNFDEKVDAMLKLGVDYFGMESGVLGAVAGESYQIKNVKGTVESKLKVGQEVPFKETFSGLYLLDNQACFSVEKVSESALSGSLPHSKYEVESYIGATVYTGGGPYGTVYFSSREKRKKPFTSQHNSFAMLMSSWFGFLVENQEYVENLNIQAEFYKSLFENVPVMIFLADKEGLIISASDRLCEMLEVERNRLPGQEVSKVFDFDDDTAFRAALEKGSVSKVPLTLLIPGGRKVDVELSSSIKQLGALQGVRLMALMDVSSRNLALKNFEMQNDRLEHANESLNRFAFAASHDLQEPLRKIQQFSSFLAEDSRDQLSTDGQSHLNTILGASERMSALISDLLTYSGASREEPNKEAISLNQILKDVQDELQLRIVESNAKIVIGDLPDVIGDRSLVRQLFTNLMSNGIKYHSLDKQVEIVVMAYSENGYNGVTVSDNGIGFEMEYAKSIFEPFNRLHRTKEYKGNGIGLAICSMVCEKHGWNLKAQSEVGAGSVFTIEFSNN